MLFDDFIPFSIKRSQIFLKMCSVLSNNSSNNRYFMGDFPKIQFHFLERDVSAPSTPLTPHGTIAPLTIILYNYMKHVYMHA